MDLVGAFQILLIWQLYRVSLHSIDILKLKTYECLYSVIHKIYTKVLIVIAL